MPVFLFKICRQCHWETFALVLSRSTNVCPMLNLLCAGGVVSLLRYRASQQAQRSRSALHPKDPPSWYAATQRRLQHEWVTALTPEHIAELDAAVAAVLGLNDVCRSTIDGERGDGCRAREGRLAELITSRASFPLPTLGPVLARVGKTVATGRGFALLRGVPTAADGYSIAQSAAAFLGLSMHLGEQVGRTCPCAVLVLLARCLRAACALLARCCELLRIANCKSVALHTRRFVHTRCSRCHRML